MPMAHGLHIPTRRDAVTIRNHHRDMRHGGGGCGSGMRFCTTIPAPKEKILEDEVQTRRDSR